VRAALSVSLCYRDGHSFCCDRGRISRARREEQDHASRIAKRIKELGGKPEMNPAVIAGLSHTEFKEGNTLANMIGEDLVAERIVIETYREMVHYFGDKDPTSRRLMEDILANEEEHADELADVLFAISPAANTETQPLYFADELSTRHDGDTARASVK
jgi:bacterioferritin